MSTSLTFADAVRGIARLAPSVRAGVIGAVAACGLATAALAGEASSASPYRQSELDRQVSVVDASMASDRSVLDFLVRGTRTIGEADLSSLEPRDAVRTIKGMAAAVLKNAGLEFERGPIRDVSPDDSAEMREALGRAKVARSFLDETAGFLRQTAESPYVDPGVEQFAARGVVLGVVSSLDGTGVDLETTSREVVGDVGAELRKSLEVKLEAVRRVAENAPGADADEIGDLVIDVLSATDERAPAPRVLLAALVDRVAADRSDPSHEDVVKLLSKVVVADGALRNVGAAWEDQRGNLGGDQIARIAKSALRTLDALDREPSAGLAFTR